jgi:hypothetical protein
VGTGGNRLRKAGLLCGVWQPFIRALKIRVRGVHGVEGANIRPSQPGSQLACGVQGQGCGLGIVQNSDQAHCKGFLPVRLVGVGQSPVWLCMRGMVLDALLPHAWFCGVGIISQ